MSGLGTDLIGSGTEDFPTNTTTQEPCFNPFDDPIYSIVAAVAAASGGVSFLACCFIIFIIILFKKWKFFSQRLILYLAIAASLLSLAMVLQQVDYNNIRSTPYENFCVFAGFLSQVTGWMVLDTVICIQIFLLLTAFTEQQPEKFEGIFLAFIFLFPLAFNWIPFINLTYGKAGAWCWIRSKDDQTCEVIRFGQILQLVLWYVPLYVLMFVLIVLYILVLIKLHSMRKKWSGDFDPHAMKKRKQMSREILPLIIYPLIFFMLNIPPFINRLYALAKPNDPEPVLWFISALVFPLQGGAIAVGFSLDKETRKRLNMANFTAAFSELCQSSKVKEYPVATAQEFETNGREAEIESKASDKKSEALQESKELLSKQEKSEDNSEKQIEKLDLSKTDTPTGNNTV